MTPEELAAALNGRQYGEELSDLEEKDVRANGLVVLFGASDDLAEFRGAIHDVTGCWGEDCDPIVILDGELFDDSDDCECKWAEAARERAEQHGREIQPVWSKGGYSWSYETDIPHATFDVLEGEEKYCRGIVFRLAAVR